MKTTTRRDHQPFVALEVSLELIRALQDPLRILRQHDAPLATQITRAASSVPLNLAEGRRRAGRDRLHSFRIASGSADEVNVGLRVAEAWDWLDDSQLERPLQLGDRLLALIWGLTR